MCSNGKHNLEKIYRLSDGHFDTVVRWCSDCGAIVVDGEYDGRVSPGMYMPMKLPKLAQADKKNKEQ